MNLQRFGGRLFYFLKMEKKKLSTFEMKYQLEKNNKMKHQLEKNNEMKHQLEKNNKQKIDNTSSYFLITKGSHSIPFRVLIRYE